MTLKKKENWANLRWERNREMDIYLGNIEARTKNIMDGGAREGVKRFAPKMFYETPIRGLQLQNLFHLQTSFLPVVGLVLKMKHLSCFFCFFVS